MEKSHIAIKFNKEAIQSRTNEVLTLKTFATQDNFLNQFTYRSIVTDEMLSPQKKINTINFENLVGICYVIGLDKLSLEEKENLAKKMAAYDFVEYAYVKVPPEIPKVPTYFNTKNEITRVDKTLNETPNFTHLQTYKDGIEEDHIGIDMEYAWSIGITGQGVNCSLLEIDEFNFQHINLKRDSFIRITNNEDDDIFGEHGNATAGIMYANDVGFGVRGMVHGADNCYASGFIATRDGVIVDLDFEKTLARLCLYLKAGDVLSISISNGNEGPLDTDIVVWEVFKEVLDAGIIICIAAGNHHLDLDNDYRDLFVEWRRRPDIGVIRVGAGDKLLHTTNFTNFGRHMVPLQAWGNYDVVTVGLGDLYDGGPNNNYRDSFGGTSAACPIVASAAVAVQSWYKRETGNVLSPFEMRELLIETGIPQKDPENGHIGPIPNIRNAITELEHRMKKEYNWTTAMAPLYGIPMYDNDGNVGDLSIEFHPRDSYDETLKKLFKLVDDNHVQYHLSMIDAPTDEQRDDVKRLSFLLDKKLKRIFLNQQYCEVAYTESEIEVLQEKVFSYHNHTLKSQKRPSVVEKYLEKYDAQYKLIEIPFSANYIGDDDFFAYRRIAGSNPLALKRITAIPNNFPINVREYQRIMHGDTIETALKENRLYMLDFSNLAGAVAENGVYKSESNDSNNDIIGYSYQAMALFAVSKEDGLLKTIAIQCSQDPLDNQIMYSGYGWNWDRAKLVIQAADKTEHQLYRHLGIAHLMGEVFALATYRNFEKTHPLYKLLISHMEGTNRVNHNAIIKLFGEGQFIDMMMADKIDNLSKKVIDMRLEHDFYDNFFPTDLKNRGVDDTEAFPVYPYRDDGLLIWNAIYDWVNAYIRTIYKAEAALKNDVQLMAWMSDIVENGKIKGFRIVETRDELIDILTMIIFSSSAYHAAVNYPQKSYMMYSPGMIGTLAKEKPYIRDPDDQAEEGWVATLPGLIRSLYKIDVYTLIGTMYNGYLGEYVDRDLKPLFSENDGVLYMHLQQFRNRLNEIEAIISERNKARPYPYETLMPKNIPASVNI